MNNYKTYERMISLRVKLLHEERVVPSKQSWGHRYLRIEEGPSKETKGTGLRRENRGTGEVTEARQRMRNVNCVKFKAGISKRLHRIRMTLARIVLVEWGSLKVDFNSWRSA